MDTKEKPQEKTWDWKSCKPNNMIPIKAGPDTGFFKWWCIYMRPIVPLTSKEVDVVAAFLKQRYELSKVISDPAVLDSQLMSPDSKNKVIQDSGITLQHFYVVLSNLRKRKIITDKGINPRLVPNIRKDNGDTFQLLILFKDPDKK